MSNFPALEVVIGLTFVYFVLSLICSAATESIASWRGWRAAKLEEGIKNLLSGNAQITPEGAALAKKVYDHPLIQALIKPASAKQTAAGKSPWPSYIPSRTFVTALLDVAETHVIETKPGHESSPPAEAGGSPPHSVVDADVEAAIAALPSVELRRALLALYSDAKGDAEKFRHSAEQWFDDSMQRVSGWYRRHVQLVLWVLGIVVVVFLNVDTLQVAEHALEGPGRAVRRRRTGRRGRQAGSRGRRRECGVEARASARLEAVQGRQRSAGVPEQRRRNHRQDRRASAHRRRALARGTLLVRPAQQVRARQRHRPAPADGRPARRGIAGIAVRTR